MPADDHDWDDTPKEITTNALNDQARIRENCLVEVEALYGEGGDWQHGFYSGILAALRLVLTSIDPGIDQPVGFGSRCRSRSSSDCDWIAR